MLEKTPTKVGIKKKPPAFPLAGRGGLSMNYLALLRALYDLSEGNVKGGDPIFIAAAAFIAGGCYIFYCIEVFLAFVTLCVLQ